eukprot:6682580-Lingulodinium_polyedra.AAC.1
MAFWGGVLPGELQSVNRAELVPVIVALSMFTADVHFVLDSSYAVDAVHCEKYRHPSGLNADLLGRIQQHVGTRVITVDK